MLAGAAAVAASTAAVLIAVRRSQVRSGSASFESFVGVWGCRVLGFGVVGFWGLGFGVVGFGVVAFGFRQSCPWLQTCDPVRQYFLTRTPSCERGPRRSATLGTLGPTALSSTNYKRV